MLAVVAHPDDETFGLGAVIDALTSAAVVWRRLQLQGDCEHLRWIEPGGSAGAAEQPSTG